MVQAWHGRFMVLAWGICVPTGILIARFFKVTPGQDWPRELDNPFWWRSHLTLQITAGLAMVLGLGFILADGLSRGPQNSHAWFGRAILLVVFLQYMSGLLRGTKGGPTEPRPDGSLFGDHYSMTRRRRIFEAFHKVVGYCLLLSAPWVVLQGLWLTNAPVWMWIVILMFWGALIGLAVILSNRPRVTTYQAIWGHDADAQDSTAQRSE